MNAINAKVQSVIENTFVAAVEKLTNDDSGSFVNDIYVQVDRESGELQIYDDSENVLEKIVVFDWVNSEEEEKAFNKKIAATLKAILTVLSTKKLFDHPLLMKPLSVSLTDDSFIVLEELIFLDDDMFRLDDPLLKDLDAELNDFLDNLLSDVK